jgi:hypothetical protein
MIGVLDRSIGDDDVRIVTIAGNIVSRVEDNHG